MKLADPELMVRSSVPPMSAPCICGLRYGMHRVNDYLCPNPEWKPGNGKSQWLTVSFVRGGIEA